MCYAGAMDSIFMETQDGDGDYEVDEDGMRKSQEWDNCPKGN